MASGSADFRVLCLTGAGRSGSTLFELLCSACLSDVVAVGELHQIWDRGLLKNEPCGCGEPFRDCAFWRAVGDRSFGGWQGVDAERLQHVKRSVERYRYLAYLERPAISKRYQTVLSEHLDAMERLLSGIAVASGCRTILDASKWPPHAAAMLGLADRGVDVELLQLVRHPRGFVHSKGTVKTRLSNDRGRAEVEMLRVGPASAALQWAAFNLYGAWLLRRDGGYRFSYEELSADPAECLQKVGRRSGLAVRAPLPLRRSAEPPHPWAFPRPLTHGISGNPMRRGLPEVEVVPDRTWSTGSSWRESLAVLPALPIWRRLRRDGFSRAGEGRTFGLRAGSARSSID
jgi:hypothetical protein